MERNKNLAHWKRSFQQQFNSLSGARAKAVTHGFGFSVQADKNHSVVDNTKFNLLTQELIYNHIIMMMMIINNMTYKGKKEKKTTYVGYSHLDYQM